jgi:hypothetical protein
LVGRSVSFFFVCSDSEIVLQILDGVTICSGINIIVPINFPYLTDDQNDGDRGDNLHSVLATIQHTDGE